MSNLFERFDKDSAKQPKSKAAKVAKNLGLTYLGFARYGIVNKKTGEYEVTHTVKNDALQPLKNNFERIPAKYSDDGKASVEVEQPSSADKKWIKQYGKKYEAHVTKNHKNASNYDPYGEYVDSILEKSGLIKAFKDTEKKLQSFYKGKKKEKSSEIFHRKYTNALNHYVGDSGSINSALYDGRSLNGKDYDSRLDKWVVDTMDDAFNKKECKAPMDYSVYRGASGEFKLGKKYTFKGFMSTSIDPEVSSGFAGGGQDSSSDRGVLIKIDVKKGQKIWDIYNTTNGEWDTMEEEKEHILPRGTKLKIVEGPLRHDECTDLYTAEIVEE